MTCRSVIATLPRPRRRRRRRRAAALSPHDKLSTSISPLCLSSALSPGMPSMLEEVVRAPPCRDAGSTRPRDPRSTRVDRSIARVALAGSGRARACARRLRCLRRLLGRWRRDPARGPGRTPASTTASSASRCCSSARARWPACAWPGASLDRWGAPPCRPRSAVFAAAARSPGWRRRRSPCARRCSSWGDVGRRRRGRSTPKACAARPRPARGRS